MNISGGEFTLNGTAFTGSNISLGAGDVFTGALQDGSTFIFNGDLDEIFEVNLNSVSLNAADISPIFVSSTNPAPLVSGLRAGQTLTLQNGGELGSDFEVAGATLNIEGGVLGSFGTSAGSVVNLSGGNLGFRFHALSGSTVNISDGNAGSSFFAASSEVNITGGDMASALMPLLTV